MMCIDLVRSQYPAFFIANLSILLKSHFKMKSITKLLYLALFSFCILSCKLQKKQEIQAVEKPSNTAIIPVPKLEDDSYDWLVRHNDILEVKDLLDPEIVLIGNSITHFWGGDYPPLKYADGISRISNGPNSWQETFKNHRVLNLGFGWDRTQNVLWRLNNGELDGLDPKLVIVHIGTNNTSETKNARMNTAAEIVEGIAAIYTSVRTKAPNAKIVLMEIMPREEKPDNPRRIFINETNQLLKLYAADKKIILLDIASKMLDSDGLLTKKVTLDFCHPNEAGYQIWGEALGPFIDSMGD